MAQRVIESNNLEMRPDWRQPGNVGDLPSGGRVGVIHGSFNFSAANSPGEDAVLNVAGNYAYNNGFWYLKLGRPGSYNDATLFEYSFEVMFPTAQDFDNCRALEFQLQQNVGGLVYNMAWQAGFKHSSPEWSTFRFSNSKNGAWEPTQLKVDKSLFKPGRWVKLSAVYRRDPVAQTLTHVSLTINGKPFQLNLTRPGVPKREEDYLHAAVQLDSGAGNQPPAYVMHLRNMTVRATAEGANQ